MKEPDYDGFWEALPNAALLAGDRATAERFRVQYRDEILGLLNLLNRLELVWGATGLHPDPPEACDLCGTNSADCQVMVDGATASGEWANMCPRCFVESGHAIGWGTGQLYLNIGGGKWRLVAGGDPNALEPNDSKG